MVPRTILRSLADQTDQAEDKTTAGEVIEVMQAMATLAGVRAGIWTIPVPTLILLVCARTQAAGVSASEPPSFRCPNRVVSEVLGLANVIHIYGRLMPAGSEREPEFYCHFSILPMFYDPLL